MIAKKSRETLKDQNIANSHRNEAALKLREYQLAKTASRAVVCFLTSWSPFVCITLVGISNDIVC